MFLSSQQGTSAMHRFFIEPQNLLSDQRAVINNATDVKHLSRVLRAEVGEKIELCVGESAEWIGEIETIETEQVFLKGLVVNEVRRESPLRIDLYQGLPKADKMELIIQKNVELGVASVTPVTTKRCVAKFSDDKDAKKKIERWQKIADEAAKQSKRMAKVNVQMPLKLAELVTKVAAYDLFLVAYELEAGKDLHTLLSDVNLKETDLNIGIFIGPEGGIEVSELEALKSAGAKSIGLGPRILRTETAGMTLVSILQYALGDIL